MDPAVGKWVLMCLGRDSQRQEGNRTLRLGDMTKWLVRGHDDRKAKAHTADADAELHLPLFVRALV